MTRHSPQLPMVPWDDLPAMRRCRDQQYTRGYQGIYTPKIVMNCTSKGYFSYWRHRLWPGKLGLYLKIYENETPGYATSKDMHVSLFTTTEGRTQNHLMTSRLVQAVVKRKLMGMTKFRPIGAAKSLGYFDDTWKFEFRPTTTVRAAFKKFCSILP